MSTVIVSPGFQLEFRGKFNYKMNEYRNYHGGYFKTLISPEQSDSALALIEMALPQGVEPPLHTHAHEDETFYLLEGRMHFQIGDEEFEAGPGDAVFAVRMVPHLFRILTSEARFITMMSPGRLWNYFMEFSTPATGEPVIIPPQGPPPPEYIARLIERMTISYGITFGH